MHTVTSIAAAAPDNIRPGNGPSSSLSPKTPVKRRQQLNHDILHYLFSAHPDTLGKSELLACAQVCRRWAEIAIPNIWRRVAIRLEGGTGERGAYVKHLAKCLEVNKENGSLVRALDVCVNYEGAGWGTDWDEENAAWDEFCDRMSLLNGLFVRFCHLEKMDIRFCIRTGHLNEDQQTTLSNLLESFLHPLTLASHLRVHFSLETPTSLLLNTSLQRLGPRVEHLTIKGGWSSEDSLVNILNSAEPLKALCMDRCAMGERVCRTLQERHGATLEIFNLDSLPRDAAESTNIGRVVARCERLKEFRWTVGDRGEYDPQHFRSLDPSMRLPSSLTVLHIGGIEVEDMFWQRVVSMCPNLVACSF